MTWLLAFLIKNAVAISAIGVTAGAIANLESVAVNSIALVREANKDTPAAEDK